MKNPKPPKEVNAGNNEIAKKPQVVFSIVIDLLDNGQSQMRVTEPNVILAVVRDTLFRHLEMIREDITIHRMKQEQNRIQLANPAQLPPNLKIHQ